LQLQQQLVRVDVSPITHHSILAAHLAEFAGPIAEDQRASFIRNIGKPATA
jgi:hypothetical protein